MKAITSGVKGKERIAIAGLGGLTPVLVSLLVIDLNTLLLKITPIVILSYLIRVGALFVVGGLAGWLHKTESDPIKLFQLGIAAPALITAAMNGSRVTLPQVSNSPRNSSIEVSLAYTQSQESVPAPSKSVLAHQAVQRATSLFPSVVWASTHSQREFELKYFELPKESAAQQVFRGLLGVLPKNVWYVVACDFYNLDEARQTAKEFRKKGFAADVYETYGTGRYYEVVIGAHLTESKARELQQKAISSGLPKDTWLWTFPNK